MIYRTMNAFNGTVWKGLIFVINTDKNTRPDIKLILYHFRCLSNSSFKSFTSYLVNKYPNLKGLPIIFWMQEKKQRALQRKGKRIMFKWNPAASSVLANCMYEQYHRNQNEEKIHCDLSVLHHRKRQLSFKKTFQLQISLPKYTYGNKYFPRQWDDLVFQH